MSEVKPNHPLAEIIARKLSGITGVPHQEQQQMVRRAITSAVEFHDQKIKDLSEAGKKLDNAIKQRNCISHIDPYQHERDEKIWEMIATKALIQWAKIIRRKDD